MTAPATWLGTLPDDVLATALTAYQREVRASLPEGTPVPELTDAVRLAVASAVSAAAAHADGQERAALSLALDAARAASGALREQLTEAKADLAEAYRHKAEAASLRRQLAEATTAIAGKERE